MVGDVNLGCFIRVLSREASEELAGFRDRRAVFTAFLMLGTARVERCVGHRGKRKEVWRCGDMRGWDGNSSESKSIIPAPPLLLGTEENVDFGHDLHVGRGSRNQIIFEYGDGV
jgi:hypothetical protein